MDTEQPLAQNPLAEVVVIMRNRRRTRNPHSLANYAAALSALLNRPVTTRAAAPFYKCRYEVAAAAYGLRQQIM